MITIAGHYDIDPGSPLPAFDQEHCPAYAVEDSRYPDRALFALVTPNTMAPRHDLMRYLTRLGTLPIIRPLALDVADWSPTNDQRLIIVYERPGGPRLTTAQDPTFKPLREDEVVDKIVTPAVTILREFNARGYTHRAIRMDNLYYESADKSSFVLGECVSLPPALNQPVLYETIESGLANPAGRGPGWASDDLYSLGVLVAALLCGGELCRGMSDEEIIQNKIAQGSYGALVGRLRLSLPIMELLRGLLCDVTEQRWTIKDLVAWSQGRRQTPKQPMLQKKAARPFDIGDVSFWTSKALSAGCGTDWAKALTLCEDAGLAGWFKRSLNETDKAEKLQNLQRAGLPSSGGGLPHRLAADILTNIDPQAPLRYREMGLFPEAAPQLLGIEWEDEGRRQILAEIIRHRLPLNWFEAQKGGGAEHALLRKSFASMQQLIAQPRLGYGLERVLYEYNPHWPCRSPILNGAYVQSLLALLPALERIAAEASEDDTREPVDTHMVAFIAARARQLPERVLVGLARTESQANYRISILRLFAEVQRDSMTGPCPAFANWLARLTGPIIESYHSAEARRTAAKAIKAAADSGELDRLVLAAENPELRQRDHLGLQAAQREYEAIEDEIAWLESGAMVSDSFVQERAQRFSAVACGCLSSFAFLLMTIYYVG